MKEENKKKNFNTFLYLRMDKDDKEKCIEIAKYYGMPNVSTYFRELIKKQKATLTRSKSIIFYH